VTATVRPATVRPDAVRSDAVRSDTNSSDAVSSHSVLAARRRGVELEARIARDPAAFRILTGDRPTGPLHLGHYFGTLANRVRLQRLGVELFVLVADYQVLTDRDVAENLPEHVDGLVADYLAVGIDPGTSTVFAHSAVPALNQLLLPFLSLVSVAELRRNPTVKEEIAASRQSSVSGLMFTYPVHQAADILFCKANLVPVGKDQLPHQEITRTVARRFNDRYGEVFPVPDALLSPVPHLLGLDGQKMSKSRGNAIALSATADETARLIGRARTDSLRHVSYEPATRPEVSNLVRLAALCQGRDPHEVAGEVGDGGALALKRLAIEAVNEFLRPIRARRAAYLADRAHLHQIIRAGNDRANAVADATLREVRTAMRTAC
jgi:tryptophanyl-tRNA synthetase